MTMFAQLDAAKSLTTNQIKIVAAAIIGDMLEFFDYFEPLAKLSARAREFPSEYTTGSRRSTISSDSQRIWRRATSFRSFQASRSCPRPRAYGQGGRRGLHSAAT
jgi:hypothetical protein